MRMKRPFHFRFLFFKLFQRNKNLRIYIQKMIKLGIFDVPSVELSSLRNISRTLGSDKDIAQYSSLFNFQISANQKVALYI